MIAAETNRAELIQARAVAIINDIPRLSISLVSPMARLWAMALNAQA